MRCKMWTIGWLLLVLSRGWGCAPSPTVEAPEIGQVEAPEIGQVEALEGKADLAGETRVRAGSMTLWLKPTVVPRWMGDHPGWILAGRTSRNLKSLTAFSHAGPLGVVTIVSARKFELSLSYTELITLVGGARLFLAIAPATGSTLTYHAMIELQPRFTRFEGDPRIFVYSWIDAVMNGFDLVFRGRLKTGDGVTMRGGFNDDDSEPLQSQEGANRWRYDWAPSSLLLSGDPVEDPIYFAGTDAAGIDLGKRASIEMVLRRVALANTGTPATLWPAPLCSTAVLSCLKGLGDWPADSESCGSAREVVPCLSQMPQPPEPPIVTQERFASDLRKAIIAFYAEHESEVLAAGGNTRPQALLAVDTAKIQLVEDADENALGYPLDEHLVYAHPDVVYPGSDIVWFGVYRKSDGLLVELTPFN